MENFGVVDLKEIDHCLDRIDTIFNLNKIVDNNIQRNQIINYYRDSSFGYKYFHSKEGAVHMAINYDGVFDKSGYYTQLNEIAELIKIIQAKNVLELGCGKGFNSSYIAQIFPDISFTGIDITDKHLKTAKQKSIDLDNLQFEFGDFHDLHFEDSSFDLIFELESICHARDSRQVLEEIYRVLKNKGTFVLYEGFRQVGFNKLPTNLKKAAVITEKSMAVNRFEQLDIWLEIAQEVGFKVSIQVDLSKSIMPNLARLQSLSRKYFKYPFLSKSILLFLPRNMVMNSIAGMLMPFTVYNKAHCYQKIILEKPES